MQCFGFLKKLLLILVYQSQHKISMTTFVDKLFLSYGYYKQIFYYIINRLIDQNYFMARSYLHDKIIFVMKWLSSIISFVIVIL